jgi:hypothetical protein
LKIKSELQPNQNNLFDNDVYTTKLHRRNRFLISILKRSIAVPLFLIGINYCLVGFHVLIQWIVAVPPTGCRINGLIFSGGGFNASCDSWSSGPLIGGGIMIGLSSLLWRDRYRLNRK